MRMHLETPVDSSMVKGAFAVLVMCILICVLLFMLIYKDATTDEASTDESSEEVLLEDQQSKAHSTEVRVSGFNGNGDAVVILSRTT
jgi:hypothetical protein